MTSKSNNPRRPGLSRRRLDELIAEATVDAYNDDEQLTAFYTMIEDNLVLPFQTEVLGVGVVVRRIDLTEDRILAVCQAGGRRQQRISIEDLPTPQPPPDGWDWVAAYREWRRRGWG